MRETKSDAFLSVGRSPGSIPFGVMGLRRRLGLTPAGGTSGLPECAVRPSPDPGGGRSWIRCIGSASAGGGDYVSTSSNLAGSPIRSNRHVLSCQARQVWPQARRVWGGGHRLRTTHLGRFRSLLRQEWGLEHRLRLLRNSRASARQHPFDVCPLLRV